MPGEFRDFARAGEEFVHTVAIPLGKELLRTKKVRVITTLLDFLTLTTEIELVKNPVEKETENER